MSTKLATVFPSTQLLSEYPYADETHVYTFYDENSKCWMTIEKAEVSDREYTLLSTLYQEIKSLSNVPLSEKWIQFLYNNGTAPLKEDTEIRIIQLHLKIDDSIVSYLNEAVKAFFEDAMQLVIISSESAVLIEQKSTYIYTPDDFSSFIGALESDFFLKVKMYVGKFHSTALPFSPHYLSEKEWFFKGLSWNRTEQIYTMEKVFPFSLIDQISNEMKQIIQKEVLEPIEYDAELLQSVQLLFENGFNVSVAAKKLHVHRNTLQYRLTKFQDITDINIRNFDGALIAYCASLLAIER